MDCLDERILSSYLCKGLSDAERGKIEEHIANCNHCLDMLVVAYEAQGAKQALQLQQGSCSRRACSARGSALGKASFAATKRKRPELKWLIGALFFFGLSFIFKRYFLQFLGAALILGFKWVMEGGGARKAIMIFKGIKNEETHREENSSDRRNVAKL